VSIPILTFLLLASHVVSPLPRQRGSIAAYWDFVSRASTVDALYGAAAPSNRASHLDGDIARGMSLVREYELTGDRSSSARGIAALRSVADKTPDDPWAHFALGVAYARSPDSNPRKGATKAERQRVSLENSVNARAGLRELVRAIELDSTFYSAAIELADVAALRRDQKAVTAAARVLEAGATTGSPRLLVALASLALQTRSAINVDSILLRASHGDASLAYLQRAVIEFAHRSIEDGVSAYWAGVEILTPESARLFIAALPVAGPSQRDAILHLEIGQTKELIKTFWSQQAARTSIPAARLIALHYANLCAEPLDEVAFDTRRSGPSFTDVYDRDVAINWTVYQFRGVADSVQAVAAVSLPSCPPSPFAAPARLWCDRRRQHRHVDHARAARRQG
jgi:hypothetical protein